MSAEGGQDLLSGGKYWLAPGARRSWGPWGEDAAGVIEAPDPPAHCALRVNVSRNGLLDGPFRLSFSLARHSGCPLERTSPAMSYPGCPFGLTLSPNPLHACPLGLNFSPEPYLACPFGLNFSPDPHLACPRKLNSSSDSHPSCPRKLNCSPDPFPDVPSGLCFSPNPQPGRRFDLTFSPKATDNGCLGLALCLLAGSAGDEPAHRWASFKGGPWHGLGFESSHSR